MHIAVNSQFFAQELRLVNKVAPAKAPLPILSHFLLRATEDALQMYATDLEIGLVTTCRARVTMPGSVALPAATMLAMVDRFPNEDVTMTVDAKSAHISCGAFNSRLQSLPANEFPQLPSVEGVSAAINSLQFHQLLTRTRYAISDETNQFLLRGALLSLKGDVGAMVGLDGKRLSLATMARSGPDIRVVIPVKTVDVLLAQPEWSDTITVTTGERHIFFQIGPRLLISRMLDSEFPKFERIIPQDCNKKAVVSRHVLAAALRRVGLIAGDDRSARFQFDSGTIEITSSAEVGEAGEKVPVQYTGEPLSVCCNWQFVVDFLEAATSATITIELKDDRTPLLLTEGDNHLAVVMLMQR